MGSINQGERPHGMAKVNQVTQIDQGKIQEHVGEVFRRTVEETVNTMLDAEADRLCRAERTEEHGDPRAGSYPQHLQTEAGSVPESTEVVQLPFEAVIER